MFELQLAEPNVVTLLLVFFSGVATSFTPCVYPILPIVLGYLGQKTEDRKQRILRPVFYVLGMSFVYAALGIFAALTGRFFGELSGHWLVSLVFGVFVLILAASMMDWYLLPIPQFLQSHGTAKSKSLSLLSAFFVGASSGVVASPCTAPVLATVLVYVASTQKILWGASLMLAFALGLNAVLLLLGLLAGWAQALPKSGLWMVRVKKSLALLMMAGGLYFVFRAGQLS